MKRLHFLLLIVSLCAGFSHGTNFDTLTCRISLNAVKADNGDCKYIQLGFKLSNTSCDTIMDRYPVFAVRIFYTDGNISFDRAFAPDVFIGDRAIDQYGGSRNCIFFKVFLDSVLESFAGKKVTIRPAYPGEKVETCLFPDSLAIAFLLAKAHEHIDTLPTLAELFTADFVVGNSPFLMIPSIAKSSDVHMFKDNYIVYNILGQQVHYSRTNGVFCLKKANYVTVENKVR